MSVLSTVGEDIPYISGTQTPTDCSPWLLSQTWVYSNLYYESLMLLMILPVWPIEQEFQKSDFK